MASVAEPVSVRILVRDYGHGVPESELVNIFDPFYRVADDRNRQPGGTCLGLAIAACIHGGTIKACISFRMAWGARYSCRRRFWGLQQAQN